MSSNLFSFFEDLHHTLSWKGLLLSLAPLFVCVGFFFMSNLCLWSEKENVPRCCWVQSEAQRKLKWEFLKLVRVTRDDCSRLPWERPSDLDPRYGQQRKPPNNWTSYLATSEHTQLLNFSGLAELEEMNTSPAWKRNYKWVVWQTKKNSRTEYRRAKGKALREMEEEGSLEPNKILANVSFFSLTGPGFPVTFL